MNNYPLGAEDDPRAPWKTMDPPEWEADQWEVIGDCLHVELSWQPFDEELPTQVEIPLEDLFEFIEHRIYHH